MKIKNFLRVFIIVGLLLLIPVWGNSNVEGWNWTAFDFVWAAIVLSCAGLSLEFFITRPYSTTYKAAGALAVVTALLMIWINAAVQIVGEDNPTNAIYVLTVAVLLFGSVASKFKADNMPRVLHAAALMTAVAPIIGFTFWREDFTPGILHVFVLNAFFIMMWMLSAMLFKWASKEN